MLTGLMSDVKERPRRDACGAAGGADGGEGAAERDLNREKRRDATENEEHKTDGVKLSKRKKWHADVKKDEEMLTRIGDGKGPK